MKVKGPEALRLSYLYDGTKKTNIPPVDIFYKNNYKGHDIPDLPREKLAEIVKYNCLYDDEEDKPENILYPFKSMINHGSDQNVYWENIAPNVLMMFTLEDVDKGDELLTDYVSAVVDKDKRKQLLFE